jgi:hypothetical protein
MTCIWCIGVLALTTSTMALTSTNQALLDAQLDLWHNTFGYIKSMALKSALDLRIADAIHSHGGGATLPQVVAAVKLHPSKIPCLRRLMRVLAATGVLSADQSPSGGGEPVYALTPVSRLLVGSSQNLAPFTAMILHPSFVAPFLELGTWFQKEMPEPCVFKHTHGLTLWEHAGRDATFDALVNDSMVSDSHFIMDIAIKECPGAFQGISSLVDVGGGLGAAAQAISKAFPGVKCSVLDLDHVVAKAPSGTGVQYIAGDMFESVPPADAMFFKVHCLFGYFPCYCWPWCIIISATFLPASKGGNVNQIYMAPEVAWLDLARIDSLTRSFTTTNYKLRDTKTYYLI